MENIYTKLEIENGVAVAWLDQPGERVNKLAGNFLAEFESVFDNLEQRPDVRAVVMISKKEDNFIIGADLQILMSLQEKGALSGLMRRTQQLLNRIEFFSKPVVAAIHGPALGGGLEVALACHYRLTTDSPKTFLGQPEVKMGLLPGAGATQRLPRLVGLQRALDIMLTGKNIYPHPAKKMGLVDEIIHPHALLDAAKRVALKLAGTPQKRKRKESLLNLAIEGNRFTRGIIYKKAREMVEKQTRGNYPAPEKILECVETGLEKGIEAGYVAEAEALEMLAHTPHAKELVNLFFAVNAMKKNPQKSLAKPIQTIGVLGAGLMGSGIAHVSAAKKMRVVIKDVSREKLAQARKNIWTALDKKVKKRALSDFERDEILGRINSVLEYHSFKTANLVVEAVFEDLALKQELLKSMESVLPEDGIFASNTSSIPITEIAAVAERPAQVIGMHYFSPVEKMPLLEVVTTPQTADWVTATAVETGIRQGKTVIVVKDGPGFYTTRILSPLLNEALELLAEEGEIRHIDQTMQKFGFPVGPFTLMDEVGIDVGAHVTRTLEKLVIKRGYRPKNIMIKMSQEGYQGRKNKKGFYHYHDDADTWKGIVKKKKEVNHTVYKFFGGSRRKKLSESDIQTRLVMMMVNEAAHCLQEGIVASPQDGDVGAVLGLGFPPFLGGPFRYMDGLTLPVTLATLEELARQHGTRFTPAEIIREHAATNKRFYL